MADGHRSEKSIFLDALERPAAADRAAFLDRACGGDPALRAGVEALLRAHAEPQQLLDTQDGAPDTDPPAAVAGPGTGFGPYELVRPIGEGGMGTVFVAEQTHPVRREVALKVIRPGLDGRQVVARFEAERQALALMDHPNIARVLDAGTTADGRPFFVMELVRGDRITRFCDEHRLAVRDRLVLFADVCRAVQHAHQKGVIHRDLKPSNVLVALYDGKPVPKVIDFGIAKATGAHPAGQTAVTELGQVIGTPEYMSPEQAGASPLDVDTRADVYSLGVLLYELLTGTTPLGRERLRGLPLVEALRMVREDDPPRPGARAEVAGPEAAASRRTEPRRLARVLRGELDWIAMKCLEKDRARRYETADELAGEVERFLRDEPVHAGPPSVWYRFGKFARRNRVPLVSAGSVGVVLVAAVVGLAATTARLAQEKKDKSDALANEQAALANERDARAKERKTLSRHAIALAHREWLANNVARAAEILDECPAELRHWEWHYLRRICATDVLTLRGDINTPVALSPDGGRVAAFRADRSIVVWDAATGRELLTLPGHAGSLGALAFSPDGYHLASGGDDSVVRLWDLKTGKEVLALPGHEGRVRSLAYSPDGRRLASGDETTVRVWEVATGEPVHALKGHRAGVWALAFDPTGLRLASANGQDGVKVWDVQNGRPVPGPPGRGTVAFGKAAGGATVLASTDPRRSEVNVFDARTGAKLWGLLGHVQSVEAVAISGDGRYLASGSDDRSVKVWDLTTGREVRTFRGHFAEVRRVAFGPDGRRLVSSDASGVIKVWDPEFDQEGRTLPPLRGQAVADVGFGPDGRCLLLAGERGVLRLWDLEAGREVLAREPIRNPTTAHLSGDARRAAWLAPDGTVRVCEVPTGRDVFTSPDRGWGPPALGPDGRRLAINCKDGLVRAWDLADGRELLALPHGGGGLRLELGPGGRLLAVGRTREGVKVLDLDAGREVRDFPDPSGPWGELRFSPDGGRLARVTGRVTIRVEDLVSGGEPLVLRGHGAGVSSLAFSPDGRRLASGSADGTVRIWEMESGQEVLVLRGHLQDAGQMAFSPDGHRLASVSRLGTIRIWDGTPLGRPPAGAARSATDNAH
jgi:WD40 repeat protein/serine/threonine protein kinase